MAQDFFYEQSIKKYRIRYRLNNPFPNHIQNDVELCICTDGQALIHYEGKEYQIEKGEVFVAFPNTIHGYLEGGYGQSILAFISPDFLPFYRSLLCEYLEYPIVKCDTETFDYFFQAIHHRENLGKSLGYISLAFAQITSQFKLVTIKKTLTNETIFRILEYINENYRKDMSYEILSHDLGFHSVYLSRMFHSKMKLTLTDYIHILRVDYSKELLKDTEMRITDICYECGFESIRTFNRIFKKKTGFTPSEYRKTPNLIY